MFGRGASAARRPGVSHARTGSNSSKGRKRGDVITPAACPEGAPLESRLLRPKHPPPHPEAFENNPPPRPPRRPPTFSIPIFLPPFFCRRPLRRRGLVLRHYLRPRSLRFSQLCDVPPSTPIQGTRPSNSPSAVALNLREISAVPAPHARLELAIGELRYPHKAHRPQAPQAGVRRRYPPPRACGPHGGRGRPHATPRIWGSWLARSNRSRYQSPPTPAMGSADSPREGEPPGHGLMTPTGAAGLPPRRTSRSFLLVVPGLKL